MNGSLLNPNSKKTAIIIVHETWNQKIVFHREASLCFEYLKTSLLPSLRRDNPVGLMKNKKLWNRKIRVDDPQRHCLKNESIKCCFDSTRWSITPCWVKLVKPLCRALSFLRKLITKAETKSRIKPEDMQLIRYVSGMANNLNQIAHQLNTFGISAIREDLNALKQLIHKLLKRLKS